MELAESIRQLRAVLLEWRKDPAWHAHEDPIAALVLHRAERRDRESTATPEQRQSR